jgi:hypothetical protein
VENGVNTALSTIDEGKKEEQKENLGGKNLDNSDSKDTTAKTDKEKNSKEERRTHKKYKTSINHAELKALEGMTVSSLVDLATAVILIDGKQYNKKHLPLSKERKNDFKRYIEHYAVMELIGKRKYHIKRVYSPKQREELNEQEANILRDNSKK